MCKTTKIISFQQNLYVLIFYIFYIRYKIYFINYIYPTILYYILYTNKTYISYVYPNILEILDREKCNVVIGHYKEPHWLREIAESLR